MSSETRNSMPRWLEFTLAILGGAAALIGIVQFVLQQARPAANAPSKAQADATAPATRGVEIVDATLTTAKRRNHILGLIPSGSTLYLTIDVTIANPQAKGRGSCALLVDTTAEDGTKSSSVAARATDLDPRGEGSSFALPALPALASRFVLPAPSDAKLTAARARVRCTTPDAQLSPWRAVDLSQADWQ